MNSTDMICNLKASNETAMMIEASDSLGIIYLNANNYGILFKVKTEGILNW